MGPADRCRGAYVLMIESNYQVINRKAQKFRDIGIASIYAIMCCDEHHAPTKIAPNAEY